MKKEDSWRPDNWDEIARRKCTIKIKCDEPPVGMIFRDFYKAGADAMLEALIDHLKAEKEAINGYVDIGPYWKRPQIRWLHNLISRLSKEASAEA